MQGCGQVAIVAHSMGNRILIAALDDAGHPRASSWRRTGCCWWTRKPLVGSQWYPDVTQLLRSATLVFAAADVGRREFVRVLQETAAQPVNSCQHLRTVYRSYCDRALAISTFFNFESRAGSRLLLQDNFETIDASRSSGRHPTKHGYWAQSKAVVADLKGVVMLGQAAQKRLSRADSDTGTLRHCSCHPVPACRPHYIIHRS